jgi:hypothetical protein
MALLAAQLRSVRVAMSGNITQRAVSSWVAAAIGSQILLAQARAAQSQADEQRKRAIGMLRAVLNRLKHKEVSIVVSWWKFGFEHGKSIKQQYRIRVANTMKRQSGLRVASQVLKRMSNTLVGRALHTWTLQFLGHLELHRMRCQTRSREAQLQLARQRSGAVMMQQAIVRVCMKRIRKRFTCWKLSADCERQRKVILSMEQLQKRGKTQVAMRQLRQIMARMVRGEAGMRVVLWKHNVARFARLAQQAIEAANVDQERRKCLTSAMRRLRKIKAQMVKAEVELRITVWQGWMKEEAARFKQQQHEAVVTALRTAERNKSTSAALKLMGQIMVRIVKGELGLRLVVWQGWMREYQQLRQEETTEALAAAAREHCMFSATRQMGQIMARMVKGELGLRLVVWKGMLMDYKIQQEEEEQQERRFVIALGQLRQVMARLAKGEVAMRLVLWRAHFRQFDQSVVKYRQQKQEEKLKSQQAVAAAKKQAAAMKQLKFIMTRMVKGEAGMCLTVWSTELNAYKTECRRKQHEAVVVRLQEAERKKEMKIALNSMRQIMNRATKGELSMRLMIWKRQLSEHKDAERKRATLALALAEIEAATAWEDTSRNNAQEHELILLQEREDAKHVAMNAATRQMGQIMARMVRGEAGMRVVLWKHNVARFARLAQQAIEAANIDQERKKCLTSAMRRLRQIKAQMVKAEVELRIMVWQGWMREYQQLRQKEATEALAAAAREHRMISATRQGRMFSTEMYWKSTPAK